MPKQLNFQAYANGIPPESQAVFDKLHRATHSPFDCIDILALPKFLLLRKLSTNYPPPLLQNEDQMDKCKKHFDLLHPVQKDAYRYGHHVLDKQVLYKQ